MGSQATLQLGEVALAVPAARLDANLKATHASSAKADVGLRPEHLALGNDSAWPVLVPQAQVELVEFVGADAFAWLGSPLGRLCVRVPAAQAPALAATVTVRADTNGLSLFDPATGRRL